jgi:hypothetical protein
MEPGVKISFSASKKLRNLSVEELSKEVVQNTLKPEQCNKESGRGQEKQIILSMEEIAEFFPQSTSVKMVKEEILSILRREKYGNGCQLSERSSI